MSVIKDDMVSDIITRRDMLPLSFLKKSAYTGSKRSLNYKLEKTEVETVPEAEANAADAGETDGVNKAENADGAAASAKTGGAAADAGTEEKPEPVMKTVLRVYSWIGKFAFDATPADEISSFDAEFSDAGIDAAIDHLNERLKEI